MEKGKFDIRFELNGEEGELSVVFGEITHPDLVGFEVVKGEGFDAKTSEGFPFMRATVADFPTKGYRTLSAFIQTTQSKYYDAVDDMMPGLNEKSVDVAPLMRERNFPFFAYGFPASIFSARHSDIRTYAKLNREINTFLVSFPNPGNEQRIECLAAFSWGFVEWIDERGRHNVKV
ncbi:MAG: hypothetical protein WC509_08180, partial [Candidatus Izemoplasmatales bacterium]